MQIRGCEVKIETSKILCVKISEYETNRVPTCFLTPQELSDLIDEYRTEMFKLAGLTDPKTTQIEFACGAGGDGSKVVKSPKPKRSRKLPIEVGDTVKLIWDEEGLLGNTHAKDRAGKIATIESIEEDCGNPKMTRVKCGVGWWWPLRSLKLIRKGKKK